MATRTGGCECGRARYSIGGEAPVHIYACHCLNCQTRSGSAFAEHALIAGADFDPSGATVSHHRQADGIEFEEVFCAQCFTRLFNRNSAMPDMIFLRAGTLDDSAGLRPILHIWTSRMQDWITLPQTVPTTPHSPTPAEFTEALRKAQAG